MKFITQTIKHKDAILKNQKQMSYKRYQNKVVDLNISKEVYYKNYFQKIIQKKNLGPCEVFSMKLCALKNNKTIPPSFISVEGKKYQITKILLKISIIFLPVSAKISKVKSTEIKKTTSKTPTLTLF